ncbi:CCAAT-binding factor, subunit A (HAP3) [Handroanthus impetiginosus]|uniref:CCAAT-binding factor, subunit A (HAP3) n=1 Tax=Handroanthus impetiginosus TaxID=429701 RepID=A0A2G9HQX5_9LAMI|nr:CCAAT-binding factor, subunit A (HAP3) [Handroanthus impetiginosus]
MKRERDNIEDDERPQTGPNKTNFRTNPENTYSKINNINNNNNNIIIPPTNINNNNNVSNANASSNTNANRSTGTGTSTATADNNSNNNNNNKEQDRFLPIANVGRIMKKVIPGNGKISKDAKETVQECVSEFISFVTGEASDKCQREKRKTINGDDILWAITTLGFEDYVNPLKLYLTKYRELEGEKLNVPKQQRGEQRLQHEQTSCVPYNNVYSSTNMMSQPSFVSNDSPFPLNFSQNPMQAPSLSQQDHVDEHW